MLEELRVHVIEASEISHAINNRSSIAGNNFIETSSTRWQRRDSGKA
jgi:hypothetical protein